MNGLVDAVALALAVGNSAQASAGQETNATRDNTGLVTNDIAEKVAGDDNAVEAGGVLDHDHGRTVNELVLDLEVGEFLLERLGHDLAPQTAGGQNVSLVERPDLLLATAAGEEASETGNALNLGARVGLHVPSGARAVVLLAVAKVDAAGQFADDDEVGAAADLGLEGRGVDEGVGGEEAGAQVSVRAHLLAQPQQALLGADSAGAPFGTANGTEEDGVGGLGGGEGLVCEGGAVGIDGALGERWRSASFRNV